MEDYLNGGKWKVLQEFVEIESGKRKDRPQLAKALAACRIYGAKLVIAKFDRLSRNAHFLLGLKESGVDFVAADMPDANRMTVGIMAMVAEHEGRAISERTKAALAAAKRRGVKLGGYRGATLTTGGGVGQLVRHAGDIAAWARQTCDQTDTDWVCRSHEDDRYGGCRLLGRHGTGGRRRDDDINLEPDELGSDLPIALALPFRPAILNRDGSVLDPAEFAQSLRKCSNPGALYRRRARAQEPNRWQFRRLLCPRCEWPRCRSAEQGDELAGASLDHLVGKQLQRAGHLDAE